MTIEERMSRNEAEDQIYIGQLAEQHLRGEFGQMLRCIIEGIKDDKLYQSEKNSTLPADRTLGIIVGLAALQSRLEECVRTARSLTAQEKEGKEVTGKKDNEG